MTLIDGLLWAARLGKHTTPAAELARAVGRYAERTGRVADCVVVCPDELERWTGLGLLAVADPRQRRGEILVGRLR